MKKKLEKAICANCSRREACQDIPGFCLMLPYIGVASIVLLLIYFISNSQL